MRIQEIFYPKSIKRKDKDIVGYGDDRNIHKKLSKDDIANITSFAQELYNRGFDYSVITKKVYNKFGADAMSYVRRAVQDIAFSRMREMLELNESVWSLPDSKEKIKKLNIIIKKPITPSAAKIQLQDILGNDILYDILDSMDAEDPDQYANDAINNYIKTAVPEIHGILRGNECLRGNCEHGELSTLGHQFE